MAIDTFREKVISIEDAAKHVSKLTKKKRNRSLILRWANQGVAGVRLETIRIGSDIYTSREALNEFMNASREAKFSEQSQATTNGLKAAKLIEEAATLGI